jgi:hypothetical protein
MDVPGSSAGAWRRVAARACFLPPTFSMSETSAVSSPTVGAGALWAGMLGPPLLMLANLQARYMLAPWECRTGNGWVGHAVTAVLLLLDLLAGLGAARQLSRVWHDGSVQSRPGFMAMLGVSESLLFGAVIIAQWIPRAYLSACQ